MRHSGLVVLAAGLMLMGGAAQAGQGKTVVELFTSQGCYSCPPAEAYLGRLADRDDVVALEFHVDYWDDLVYGLAGKWKDPFSSPAYTRRQQLYNINIRGQSGVYTPQMVIGGRYEAVGSRTSAVDDAIRRHMNEAPSKLNVRISERAGKGLSVRIDGADKSPAVVWLVRFDHAHTTRVRSGENKGKTLTSRNIVRATEKIGTWNGRAKQFDLDGLKLADNEGCAILVQSTRGGGQGPILGAELCPRPSS